MIDKKYEVFFWFIVFGLAISFFFVMVIDRGQAQEIIEGENITVDGKPLEYVSIITSDRLLTADKSEIAIDEMKKELFSEKRLQEVIGKYYELQDNCNK